VTRGHLTKGRMRDNTECLSGETGRGGGGEEEDRLDRDKDSNLHDSRSIHQIDTHLSVGMVVARSCS
jgi:hypothetical protein